MDNSINYEQIAQAVKERRESSLEFQHASHKEVISNILLEHRSSAQQEMSNSQFPISNQNAKTDGNLPAYADTAPQDTKQKTEDLIQYTFQHGLRAGMSLAIKEDPFVLDLYHDTLTEQLHQQLIERKLL